MAKMIDLKEQVKIHDLRRLDEVMTQIDQIAQSVRKKQLSRQDMSEELSSYLSFLEILWKNLLRPHIKGTERTTMDNNFDNLVDEKKRGDIDQYEMLTKLRTINNDLYEAKEKVKIFNAAIKNVYEESIDFDSLWEEENDKTDSKSP